MYVHLVQITRPTVFTKSCIKIRKYTNLGKACTQWSSCQPAHISKTSMKHQLSDGQWGISELGMIYGMNQQGSQLTIWPHAAYFGNVFKLLGYGDAVTIMPVLLALTAVDSLGKGSTGCGNTNEL